MLPPQRLLFRRSEPPPCSSLMISTRHADTPQPAALYSCSGEGSLQTTIGSTLWTCPSRTSEACRRSLMTYHAPTLGLWCVLRSPAPSFLSGRSFTKIAIAFRSCSHQRLSDRWRTHTWQAPLHWTNFGPIERCLRSGAFQRYEDIEKAGRSYFHFSSAVLFPPNRRRFGFILEPPRRLYVSQA